MGAVAEQSALGKLKELQREMNQRELWEDGNADYREVVTAMARFITDSKNEAGIQHRREAIKRSLERAKASNPATSNHGQLVRRAEPFLLQLAHD
jgi:hypothetical protein